MPVLVHVREDGSVQPRAFAVPVQRRRAGNEKLWVTYLCTACQRTFEVRLGEAGEHRCRPG